MSSLSEMKSQVREKGSAETLAEVTRRLQCHGPVYELTRREVRTALLE